MGVIGLWKLIDASGKPVPLETLENKVLAIDISIWLHQVVKGFQDQKGNALPNAHLLGLFNRLCKLLFYRIKPVFVFDGGVPALKRETIIKRGQAKSKHLTEADRIQQLLLSSLAKEKIVQQALGVSAESLTKTPTKSPKKKFNPEPDSIFKLPELKEDLNNTDDTSVDDSMTDNSLDEENEANYYKNLKSIDVNSVHFKTLPADIRYDILQEITETRKHASWGTLHELPAQSLEFCSFQMKRLLKRHQVQQKLEEAEKEIGGACLSLDVLEQFFTEDGLESLDKKEAVGGQLASDENTRFILVRDLKKAMEDKKKVEPIDPGEGTSTKNANEIRNELAEDEDDDMQRAIQLSLMDDKNVVELNQDQCDDEPLKFTTQQKKVLSDAAKSLARGFILEHGGITNEEFDELIERHDTDDNINSTFQYNDKFIVRGDEKSPEKKIPETKVSPTKSENDYCEVKSISSDADSDFVDVADINDFESPSMNVFPVFPMTADLPDTKDMSRDFRLSDLQRKGVDGEKSLEVVIKVDEKPNVEDDIFADIFIKKDDKMKIDKSEISTVTEKKSSVNDILEQLKREKEEIAKINLDTLAVGTKSPTPLSNPIDMDELMKIKIPIVTDQEPPETIENNDDEIDSEATIIDEELLKYPAEDISPPDVIEIDDNETDNENVPKTIVQSELNKFFTIHRTPKKEDATIQVAENDEVVPNVATPYFVKRTPGSSNKKSSAQTDDSSPQKLEKSKVSKSLFPESVENSSKTTLVNPEEIIRIASEELRDTKSKDELETMMSEIANQRVELESAQNRQNRFGSSITQQMNEECMKLLQHFGVPYIVAPMEAEAQCAFLNHIKLTDGTITDDSDIWLFGGQIVYKNFFNNKKHVMEFRIENIETLFSMDRKKMIQVAMLVGSDYTTGIAGIGAVTALEILAAFPSVPEKEGETNECMSMMSGLRKFRDWIKDGRQVSSSSSRNALKGKLKNIEITEGFPLFNVAQAYLYPKVDDNKSGFTWGYPDTEAIYEFAKKNFGWTKLRIDETLLPVLKKLDDRKTQQTIKNFFKLQCTPTSKNLQVSKRVKNAIDRMAGRVASEDEALIEKVKKPRVKRAPKKSKIPSQNDGGDQVIEILSGDTPNTKPSRKRKSPEIQSLINNDTNEDGDSLSWKTLETTPGSSTPTTSKLSLAAKINKNSTDAIDGGLCGPSKTKNPRIPNTKLKIPQREKDEQERENNRRKAIEIFKKSNGKH